ncbi:50S ribosomal protein L9 [candidate division KSB1 bacterium 4572_119]|nr:MAG: 50S ribosomal protein L9 [candidate division KSB1 bacterium 4572_119]
MKIILCKDYESLGKAGDVVTVKDGFARNLLIPKGIALKADKTNIQRLENEKKHQELKISKDKKEAELLAEELNKISCTATVTVGEEDKIFGSITTQNIADLLKEKGFEIDRKKIVLQDPIKALGIYEVPIKIHPEVESKIKLWVVKE